MTVQQQINRTLIALVALVMFMGMAAWASVPLYDWFCRVTGFGGTTLTAATNSSVVLEEQINIRFDASLERGMPWEFQPEKNHLKVKIGESNIAYYKAHNPTSRPVAGTASFNVFPFTAGEYFVKIDCFCFEEQILQPGETTQMPVIFYIDPEIVDDPEASQFGTITLSYTFHKTTLETS